MKHIKYLLFIVLLSLPICVNGLEANPVVNCDKSILLKGESSNCTIKLQITSGGVKKFVSNLETSSNLQISNMTVSNAGTNTGSGNHIDVSFAEVVTSTINMASFTVTASDVVAGTTESVNLNNIQAVDETDEHKTYQNVSTTLRIPSDDVLLSSLTIDVGTLSPLFSPEITEYSTTVDTDKIEITAIGHSNTSITGTGIKDLYYGKNTFQIIVRAEAGNVKTYSITVTRENNKSSDSSLKSLKINGANINFSPTITSYKDIILSSDIDKLTVTATANDSKATVKYSSNDVKLELDATETIYIYVTAENGDMTTYSVTATRKDNRSSNNNLKSLTMNNKNVTLGSSHAYTLTVDNSVTSAKVEAITQDSKAIVKINGNKDLEVGNNVFEIVVTAENGSLKTYKLTVIRKNSDGDITNLSNNSDLKSLEIEDIELNFDKNNLDYSFEVENVVTKLKIKYTLDDSKASAIVEGNDNLKVGLNTVKIIVTAENGESSTYLLKVTRKDKNYEVENNTNSIIKALKDEKDYEKVIVKVEADDNLLIPNNIIKALMASKKIIIYQVMNKNQEQYSITLNGSLFTSYEDDINYGLNFESNNTAFKEKIGSRKNIILSFKQNNDLPTGTMYNIYVGDTYTSGSTVYLYRYNNEKNELELVKDNLVVNDNFVIVNFEKLSEFVLLDSKLTDEDDVMPKPIDDGDNKVFLYGTGGALVLIVIIVIVIMLTRKKKNSSKKSEISKENDVSTIVSEETQPISIPEIKNINLSNNSIIEDKIDLIDIDDNIPDDNLLLGISVMDVNDYLKKCPLADFKNSGVNDGIVIVGFDIDSPIQRAGMRQGDVLLQINNQKITNKEHFRDLVSQVNHGMEVSFTYYRNGEIKEFKVLL